MLLEALWQVQTNLIHNRKLSQYTTVPATADSLSDNSIAFCKEVLSEKTELFCSPSPPWA